MGPIPTATAIRLVSTDTKIDLT